MLVGGLLSSPGPFAFTEGPANDNAITDTAMADALRHFILWAPDARSGGTRLSPARRRILAQRDTRAKHNCGRQLRSGTCLVAEPARDRASPIRPGDGDR